MGNWRELEHTADLCLESWGESPGDAAASMCMGLASIMTEPDKVVPREERTIAAEGVDLEDTVVSLLGEFLYLTQVKGWLAAEARPAESGETRMAVALRGEPFDASRHRLHKEIKAATFHDFACAPDGEGVWRLRVVFDV
jgi:SHS2 domain-containing protein